MGNLLRQEVNYVMADAILSGQIVVENGKKYDTREVIVRQLTDEEIEEAIAAALKEEAEENYAAWGGF